ncbi:DNA polymerase III subunit chi [Aliiroseovarius sp. 2305UL8-7]|uniref:DNA polymerase III subunit chi n=1 Tax=Aliiroseovarius conchicola TaxID=3121637 RepID=UPI003527AF4E
MSEAASEPESGRDVSEKGAEVFFYHMTRTPLEGTLPILLQKSLDAGWRVCVRGQNIERLQRLDEILWTGAEEGFLPHGLAGGAHDADQPILLTTSTEALNIPNALISVDGAEVNEADMTGLTRVSVLFDGNDADAVAHARAQWKSVVAAGCVAKYWSQEDGPWAMKASSA